jgi:LysR family glycine cleavage system transcriptional activator
VKTRLSHLNALRAFEATARLGSYVRAADELAVTPAAVGQQVRTLEEYFGSPLFRRLGHQLILTDAARAVVPDIKEAFDRLAHVTSRLKDARPAPLVTITVPPSFAAKWLMPRLGSFRSAHPDIDVRLDTTDRLVDLARENIAVGVRYGGGRYPGLDSTRLLTEEVFPVCSPALLAGAPHLQEPDNLAAVPLIHDTAAEARASAPTWRTWLEAIGSTVDARRGLRVDSAVLALQAAIEGQGVALARSVIAAGDLREGRLIRPLRGACVTPDAYYLIYPTALPLNRAAAAFCHWLKVAACEFENHDGTPDGRAVRCGPSN